MKMTNNQKEIKSQAIYTITVNSELTPDELATKFDPLLLDHQSIVFHSLTGDSTEVAVENIELTAVEWIDNEKNK